MKRTFLLLLISVLLFLSACDKPIPQVPNPEEDKTLDPFVEIRDLFEENDVWYEAHLYENVCGHFFTVPGYVPVDSSDDRWSMLPELNSSSMRIPIVWEETEIEVFYRTSKNGVLHEYSNPSETLVCYYDETMALRQLVYKDTSIPDYETEEQYRAWFERLLAPLVTHPLEEYVYSGEGVPNPSQVFQYRYTRYVDGYATSDAIEISLSFFSKDMIQISFDEEKFADIHTVEFDKVGFAASLDRCIKASLAGSNDTFDSYEMVSQYLGFVNGRLSLFSEVKVFVVSSSGYKWSHDGTFFVFIDSPLAA